MNKEDILNPLETRKLIGLNNYFDDLIKLYDLKILPKVMLISGKKGLGSPKIHLRIILDQQKIYKNIWIKLKIYFYRKKFVAIINNIAIY